MFDRFIPTRSNVQLDYARLQLNGTASIGIEKNTNDCTHLMEYRTQLQMAIFGETTASATSILSFSPPSRQPRSHFDNPLALLYKQNQFNEPISGACHRFDTDCQMILDLPDFIDDYYRNVLAWDKKSNTIAVALDALVYTYYPPTRKIAQVFACETELASVQSLTWLSYPSVAIATSLCGLDVSDALHSKITRSFALPEDNCATSLVWNAGESLLTAGCNRGHVCLFDLRLAGNAPVFQWKTRHNYKQITGLAWSNNGHLLAAGDNNNNVNVWDLRKSDLLYRFASHTASVRALTWNPVTSNELASGSGSADRTIRTWNTAQGTCERVIKTDSQVTGLIWSHGGDQLLSAHGFDAYNLCLWDIQNKRRHRLLATFEGHTQRVLGIAQSPDGCQVVTASGDEQMRFWNIFTPQNSRMLTKCRKERFIREAIWMVR